MKKTLKLLAAASALALTTGAANAHLVSFGWLDNGDGTVSLFGEHWHGDQPLGCDEGVNCSHNGGLHISANADMSDAYNVQWNGNLVINNYHRDQMVTDGALTGYDTNTGNSGTYSDWLQTDPLVIGNGTWYFFTGTSCCIDQMNNPVAITLTGITTVDPGTGPGDVGGNVPLPAGLPLLLTGFGALGLAARKKKKKS